MTIVVMAAGMGNRYGGTKQLELFGGSVIMEYALFDAINAGFSKAVFIIKEEMLDDFKRVVGDRVAAKIPVEYVFQRLSDAPVPPPANRAKPWGTGHAVAQINVGEPFCVINADDFYGADAINKVGAFLKGNNAYCLAGYGVENTLSENGTVTRGVCEKTDGGKLASIEEVYQIHRRADGVIVDDKTGAVIAEGTPVSMNLWGFMPDVLPKLRERMNAFFESANLEKDEFLLPSAIGEMIGERDIFVLPTDAVWHGITHKEDKEPMKAALDALKSAGKYPEVLF